MKLLGWNRRNKNAGTDNAAARRSRGAADSAAVLERLDEALGRRLELGRPLSIVLTVLEAALRCGATIEVYAVKR